MTTLQNLIRYLFRVPSNLDDPEKSHLGQFILYLNWVIVIGAVLSSAFTVLPDGDAIRTISVFAIEIGYFVAVFVALKRKQVQIAIYLTVAFSLFIPILVMSVIERTSISAALTLVLPVVMAGALLKRIEINALGIILALFVFIDTLFDIQRGQVSGQVGFSESVQVVLILVIVIGIQSVFAGRRSVINEQSKLEIERLKKALGLTSLVTPNTTEDNLLNRSIRYLRESFGFDVVQIYLLDEQNLISQQIRSGLMSTERIILEHPLTLGTTHPISDAMRLKTIIQITPESNANRRSHLLPAAQYGLLVPIMTQGRVLGVVDIQSSQFSPFTLENITLLDLFAKDLAALWILVQEMQRTRQDQQEKEANNQRLQTQLNQLQGNHSLFANNVWSDYVEKRGQDILGFDLEQGTIQPAQDLPEAMRIALEQGDLYETRVGDEKLISVPIALRDNFIGAMTFAIPATNTLSERQKTMAKTIADRLGSSLENARLLEQTQAQALRERKASEIAGLLLRATDINSLLRLAADSFNDTLGAVQTKIYIEPGIFAPINQPDTDGQSHNGDSA